MLKTQTKIPTIIVILILMASTILALSPNTGVNAANQSNLGIPLPSGVTPVYERTTYAYLSVSPNPIGVGQQALVNIWTTPGTVDSKLTTTTQ